jgi:outer membrane protein assembly factor BamB
MKRRTFLGLVAAAPAVSAASLPDLGKIPTRKVGKVEVVFKTPALPGEPYGHPNGLQCTPDGLWIIDQAAGSKAYLVSYQDGKILRSFNTETTASSGITYDNGTLWIGSTYSRETVHVDAETGKTIERRFTPGAGVIYQMKGDPKQRSSPVASQYPRPGRGGGKKGGEGKQAEGGRGRGQQVGGFQMGQVLGGAAPGTGAHGQEVRDGLLWFAVPPSRMVYSIDPKTWMVQSRFPVAGNRPHGIGWEGKYLWVADSNLNAFFKHDTDTGEMVEKIQLAETDPLPHGMSIWQGNMWYCDDVGVVCRLKM